MCMVVVAVGSKNPVKINAVEKGFSHFYHDLTVVGIEVESRVPPQPYGSLVFRGARNRAVAALKLQNADFGVGIEGGVTRTKPPLAFAAVFIKSREGRVGLSTTGFFMLPREIARLLEKGVELGDAVDRVTGLKDTKKRIGAVGILTKNVIDRTRLYEHAVILALAPFVSGFEY